MNNPLKKQIRDQLAAYPEDKLLCFCYSDESQKARNDLTKYSIKVMRCSYGEEWFRFVSYRELQEFLREFDLIIDNGGSGYEKPKEDAYFQITRSSLKFKVVADFISAAGKRISCFHAVDSNDKTRMEIDFENDVGGTFKSNNLSDKKCDWFITSCRVYLGAKKAANNP